MASAVPRRVSLGLDWRRAGEALAHFEQVLVRLFEGGDVDRVGRRGGELFDQRDATVDQRQVACGELFRIWESVLVEVFNEVAAVVLWKTQVVDGVLIKLIDLGVGT